MSKTNKICPHVCSHWECRHYGGHEEGPGCAFDCKVGGFIEGGCIATGDEEEIT